jgi:hypothetical protein
MTLRFSDGVDIDTSGEPRVLRLNDGYYAVGKGILIPVDSQQAGEFMVQRMQNWEPGQNIINTRVSVLNLPTKK